MDVELDSSIEEEAPAALGTNDAAIPETAASRPPFERTPFNPEEWELVEEDHCVMELHGITKNNFLRTFNKDRTKLTGLFDPEGKSFLQLDEQIFVGEPSDTFGTNIIFEAFDKDGSSSEDEDTFKNLSGVKESRAEVKYLAQTDKKLSMYRALLLNKTSESEE